MIIVNNINSGRFGKVFPKADLDEHRCLGGVLCRLIHRYCESQSGSASALGIL